MNAAQFCVTWDSYLKYVSKGISSLQQNEEFVDMTLAAEGHLVKVHKNIVALASPYIKAMLQSASCRHPVIFLNNISHEILGYILEYIYTGEVKLPINSINTFIKACKSLYICGIENVDAPKNVPANDPKPEVKRIDKPPDNFAAHITINPQDNHYNLELISNENAISNVNNNIEEILSAPAVPNNNHNLPAEIESMDIENDTTACKTDIDINSINQFMFVEPTDNLTTEVNKSLQTLIDETINMGQCESMSELSSSHIELNSNVIESQPNNLQVELHANPVPNPVSITLNSDIWQQSDQYSSQMESFTNPVNIPKSFILKPDWKVNPIQSDANVVNTNTVENVSKDWPNIPGNKINILDIQNISAPSNTQCITSSSNSKGKQTRLTIKKVNKMILDKTPRYSISNRGSIQMILNRYIYHSHHYSERGQKRRWRCMEYRKLHCPMFIDTEKGEIVSVPPEHDHPDHDNIITLKVKKKNIYSSFSEAIEIIESQKKDQKSESNGKS